MPWGVTPPFLFIMESGKRTIEQHYSIKSAAKLLDVCVRTVRREIKRKGLKIIRVSGRIRIPESQFIKILEIVPTTEEVVDDILSKH